MENKSHIISVMEPIVGYCHLCGKGESDMTIIVAHDTQTDWNICLKCLDAAMEVDELLRSAGEGDYLDNPMWNEKYVWDAEIQHRRKI